MVTNLSSSSTELQEVYMFENGLMMQYFEWYMKSEPSLWKTIQKDAEKLKKSGVTSVWLPPAYKGAAGIEDAGYSVYDLYDIGEFKQKGTIRTKYGTKKEYIDAVQALHDSEINVYADVVLNHKVGADEIEAVTAPEFNSSNRYQMIGDGKIIGAWTKFTFPGRKGKYSDFTWNWNHFDGIDWDQSSFLEAMKQFAGEKAAEEAELKKDNFDYFMGIDIDFNNRDVYEELVSWAQWYIETTSVDGFRMDAAKHIPASFYRDFLYKVREVTGKELFTVGEYWSGDVKVLMKYLEDTKSEASLFDVPLHYNLYHCSKAQGAYDLRTILDGTLVKENPLKAVTFVDNHDTQPGQAFESFVEEWFKPMAYALILLRKEGYPCVFYGDYKGISHDKIKAKKQLLDKLMKLRKAKAYGEQHDYFDDPDCIGWTREGDAEHKDSGLAVMISDGKGGTKRMYIGKQFAGAHFSDVMGNAKYNIKIDDDGCGNFYVNRGAVAVWVQKEPKGA
ncbi:MAG: alpha-amylase [Eubacterium sp.]|nr:alpha-amylase [Eubacterium sp.]